MTLRGLIFVPFLMAANALPMERPDFTSGVWRGEANYDQDGKFRDCTMVAQSGDRTQLGFVISKAFDWGLVIADETRDLEVGSEQAVLLVIDTQAPIRAVAKVVEIHGILIPLENSEPVIEALRAGEAIRIVMRGITFSFKLTGTRDAIAKLAACVTDHLDSEKT
jgi:hypothetical protein